MNNNDLDILFLPKFLDEETSFSLLEQIEKECFYSLENIDITQNNMPRLIRWFGDKDYAYSHIHHPAKEIPIYINEIKNKINILLIEQNIDSQMNSVLINYYRDGNDKINYHSDDLTQIGQKPVICSLSLGETRQFVFKHKETKEKINFILNSGDLLIMKGDTQDIWQHAVLPETNKSKRINLTFRNTLFEAVV